ncbi:hypothetical protein CEUSTIGMA_g1421.t1 [Chlamydomonas eustigma]|uniref:ATP-dependent DNA helicase n=1 Tax=Chlamydomonas eustigma TaxID=1157962 RepID=A0A250WT41_9CHLO|nr:hypothetical protein CEUSTIGMA_g1421.t1 [Chlamydomonas eustigma]|eukprot:GAX73971.1 hypothetical protein CEUSTIGMA_g1421.t1 [Chlamydomonas eustigma]
MRRKRNSLTPDGVPQKRQATLLTSFARIDKALAIAGSKRKIVDLTKPTLSNGISGKPTCSNGSQGGAVSQSRPASHVSASCVELNPSRSLNKTAQSSLQSVSHVSDTYNVKSGQASVEAAGPSTLSADEASSPQLCPEQEKVMQLVRDGKNVFFTGNAGTGKTFMLNKIIEELRIKYGRDFISKVALAAPTGIAATHIQGTTLNAALGLGICNYYKDFGSMFKKETRARISRYEILIVDEVSMLSAELFNTIESNLKRLRNDVRPAGGLQLIMCGDFFQLPPVTKKWTPGMPSDMFLNWGYAFQAPAWKAANIEHVLLTKVFRQQDGEFIKILDNIRYGHDIPAALKRLRELCMRPLLSSNGIKATQLFSRNKEVDETNIRELAVLKGATAVFGAEDEVVLDPALQGTHVDPTWQREATSRLEKNEFFRDCLAAKEIRMKVGAQVLLIKNLDLEGGPNNSRQLVNGSRGVITSMVPKADVIRGLEANRKALGGDNNISMSKMDSKGTQLVTEVHKKVEMLRGWAGTEIPVVRFRNGAEIQVLPTIFSSTVPHTGECRRVQIPLKLAWALTIHKCQGLTLDLVQVSLKDCFAQGQAYVALSRARSLEGLQILDLDSSCVRTDPAVSDFYAALKGGDIKSLKDDAWERWSCMRSGSAAQGDQTAGFGSQQPVGSVSQQPQALNSFGASQAVLKGATGGRQNNGCFHCGQPGHWANNCPSKKGGGSTTGFIRR